MEKQLFFWTAMAKLRKYCMGGYGQIGVYRGILIVSQNIITNRGSFPIGVIVLRARCP